MDIDNVTNAPVTTVFPLQDVIGIQPGSTVEIRDAKEIDDYEGHRLGRRWIMSPIGPDRLSRENGLDVTLRSLQDGEVLPNTAAAVRPQQ